MRSILIGLALVSTPALAATDIVMHRDPGCGCCEKWASQVRRAFGRNVLVIDDSNRGAFQRSAGLPPGLGSCHTAVVDGMVFEGHVPVADMQRVLKSRPHGVRGLVVAGMPIGSAGMEIPGAPSQHYNVVAFGTAGVRVFAQH